MSLSHAHVAATTCRREHVRVSELDSDKRCENRPGSGPGLTTGTNHALGKPFDKERGVHGGGLGEGGSPLGPKNGPVLVKLNAANFITQILID